MRRIELASLPRKPVPAAFRTSLNVATSATDLDYIPQRNSVALDDDGGTTMTRKSNSTKKARRKRAGEGLVISKPDVSDEEYKVGPGRPPKEFQFKPGQSGNPKGAKRKSTSIVPDLKAQFERALSGTVMFKQGEKERLLTKSAIGIEHLVNQFAEGDRHARRDVFDLAHKLGFDLAGGHSQAIEKAAQTTLTAEDEAALADYLKRLGGGRDDDVDAHSSQSIPTQSSDSSNKDGG